MNTQKTNAAVRQAVTLIEAGLVAEGVEVLRAAVPDCPPCRFAFPARGATDEAAGDDDGPPDAA